MLAYSAVFWPVARSATKSDEYCGVLKVMAMNVGFRRILSVKEMFRQQWQPDGINSRLNRAM